MIHACTQYVDRKRESYVAHEAKALFEHIIKEAIKLDPSTKYELKVNFNSYPTVIANMILQRTRDMFTEMGSSITIERKDVDCTDLNVTLEPEPEDHRPEETILTYYWSRVPGKFVNVKTGQPICVKGVDIGQQFTGTVREWYETFVESCIDASNTVTELTGDHPRVLYVGPDVMCILEASVLYRPNFSDDPLHSDVSGTLSNRFSVMLDKSLTDTIKLITVKDDRRLIAEVKVLDMDIQNW